MRAAAAPPSPTRPRAVDVPRTARASGFGISRNSFFARRAGGSRPQAPLVAPNAPPPAPSRLAHCAGLAGEAAAERLYLAEGGRVLARRWRCPEGEIDLALELGSAIVFVEVKARRAAGSAAEAVALPQRRRLLAAASRFLAERGPDRDARIDVVLVDRSGQVERIENAFGYDH